MYRSYVYLDAPKKLIQFRVTGNLASELSGGATDVDTFIVNDKPSVDSSDMSSGFASLLVNRNGRLRKFVGNVHVTRALNAPANENIRISGVINCK